MKPKKIQKKPHYLCGQLFSNRLEWRPSQARLIQVGFGRFMLIDVESSNRYTETVLEGKNVSCTHIPCTAFHKAFGKEWKLIRETAKNPYDRSELALFKVRD